MARQCTHPWITRFNKLIRNKNWTLCPFNWRILWGNCWCGNVPRWPHAAGIQSAGTVALSVSSSSLANCFTDALRGFETAVGLVGFGCTYCRLLSLLFLQYLFSHARKYVQGCPCKVAVSCMHVCHRCALLLWRFYVEMLCRVRLSSYLQAERLLWSVGTTSRNVFGPASNPEVLPAQTIKGRPTVILALFFHYGSAAAGVLISRVGLLIKRMGTDSAEMWASGIPVSWLLGVSIGRESLWFSVY